MNVKYVQSKLNEIDELLQEMMRSNDDKRMSMSDILHLGLIRSYVWTSRRIANDLAAR